MFVNTHNYNYEYNKTWLIQNSVIQNFIIIWNLVWTYAPSRKKIMQIYLNILKTIVHNSKKNLPCTDHFHTNLPK
jgi:hypothetical protein